MRISDRRRDAAYFETVAARIAQWDGVERVETNPLTASILVYFSDSQRLLAQAAASSDLFELDFGKPVEGAGDGLRDRAAQSFAAADAALRRWTEGEVDIRGVLFVVLLVGGVYQLLHGRISAAAPSLLWRAGSLIGLWDIWAGTPSGEER